jgi:hypothetical protein
LQLVAAFFVLKRLNQNPRAAKLEQQQFVGAHGCSAYEIGVRLEYEGLGCTWRNSTSMLAPEKIDRNNIDRHY